MPDNRTSNINARERLSHPLKISAMMMAEPMKLKRENGVSKAINFEILKDGFLDFRNSNSSTMTFSE